MLFLSLLLTGPLETSFVCGMIVCTAQTRGRIGILSHFWKILRLKDPKELEEMVQKVARTLGQESLAFFQKKIIIPWHSYLLTQIEIINWKINGFFRDDDSS